MCRPSLPKDREDTYASYLNLQQLSQCQSITTVALDDPGFGVFPLATASGWGPDHQLVDSIITLIFKGQLLR